MKRTWKKHIFLREKLVLIGKRRIFGKGIKRGKGGKFYIKNIKKNKKAEIRQKAKKSHPWGTLNMLELGDKKSSVDS